MRHSEFYLKVASALAGCQILEQEIRLYIAAAHLAIRNNLPTHIPYKVSEDGNAGSSLGNLIGKFKNVKDCRVLFHGFKDLNECLLSGSEIKDRI